MRIPSIIIAAALLAISCGPRSIDKKANNLVRKMTMEEKVRMVVGTCTTRAMPPEAAPGVNNRTSYPGGVNTLTSQNQVPGAAGDGYAIPRLGIPAIVYADGPAGLRIDPLREGSQDTFYCTAFPTAALLASTWDPAVVENVGESIGNEVLHYGVDILLAPGMNIQRNPLTGRNFEYYSEDPLLAGKMAAAYVRGVQSQGVGTSVKHFAANNQELYRNGINEIISERAIREIYLRGFEIAVKESNPLTVMSSYNKINGVYASENVWLLDDVLRADWGFQGFVMTDWWAADNPVNQMIAGNDLLMPGTPFQIDEITQAVKERKLDISILDRNVKRILKVLLQTPRMKGYVADNAPDLAAHAAVSRKAATEGMVLLHNDSALPLSGGESIALFGNYAYDTQPGGSGSGYVNRAYKVSLEQGLLNAGFGISESLAGAYRRHIAEEKAQMSPENFWVIPTASEMKVGAREIASASDASIAIVTLGRMSGEGGDRSATPGDYLLSSTEWGLLKHVSDAFHSKGKKVIAVLNIGAPVELTGLDTYCDAILLAWLPGQEAGDAIADILSGKVSPSGKLPVTLARCYSSIPSAKNFGLSPGQTNTVIYEEELMVGYRYFAGSDNAHPLYPFGFGLSYTEFEYEDICYVGNEIVVEVKNTGEVAGREVVQIYVKKPNSGTDGRPALELCAFAKTPLLEPGSDCSLHIPIDKDYLREWTPGGWELVPGDYTFYAAASSEDLRLSVSVDI